MSTVNSGSFYICKDSDGHTFEVKAHHADQAKEFAKLSNRGSSETYTCRVMTDAEIATMNTASSRKGALPTY